MKTRIIAILCALVMVLALCACGGGSSASGGDTSEAAYQAYLKEYVDAVPAVSDDQYAEFAAAIDSGNYEDFPVAMCFVDTFWGYTAMTYEEFVAAGGAYEIPAFDSNLVADEEASGEASGEPAA